ncbi:hypothetical protein VTJ49DRAFT_2771 [Mycothermus thermophilus]|uniref:NADH dehydrogenase [ubiquinone] 1 alpha subcomplex subunit n=1 Tax=Humicola insolens TaxID=85995 RepID=A0ABR3V9A0_HUMIN
MSQLPFSPFLRAWYKWKMLRLPWRRKFLIGFDLNGNTYWEFLDRGAPRPPPPNLPSSSPQSRTRPIPTALRWRRIVRYPRGTHHDAVAVPPAWHQWLRHTRPDPPSLEEQRAEVARQARIKLLAAEADRRWEAKPRVMEDVTTATTAARLGVGAGQGKRTGTGTATAAAAEGVEDSAAPPAASTESTTPPPTGDKADDVAIRDRAGVEMREETWRRMQKQEQEAAAQAQKETKKSAAAQPNPWEQARRGPGEAWQPQAWEPKVKAKR